MGTALAVQSISGSLIVPVMDVAMAKERLLQFQQFVKECMVEDEDFGVIPGTPKPTLYKAGADKLCELYGLADNYEVTQRTEDFDRGLFDYEVKCILTNKAGDFLVATGLGSCNSYEKKYRWRDAQRVCPNCKKEFIIKGKDEYGGGWLCYAKKGGCGAKFCDDDKRLTDQTVGRVLNEDIADLKNTILKMAKKRSKIDATLSATRSSGLFTQDVEDWDIPKAPTVSATKVTPASVTSNPTQPSMSGETHTSATSTTPPSRGSETPSSTLSSVISHDPGEPDIRPRSQKQAQTIDRTPEASPFAPQTQERAPQGQVVGGEPVISKPQANRFFAISKSAKLTDEEVKQVLASIGFHGHRDEIPKSLYDAAIDAIDPNFTFHPRKG
jgi:hypothetical protein